MQQWSISISFLSWLIIRFFTSPTSYSSIALLGHTVTSTLWHCRLGLPSNPIVFLILRKSKVAVKPDVSPIVCQSCLEGKFSKLHFSSASAKSVIPFEVVHSDLWGPAPSVYVDGFKYYVLFVDKCTGFCWLFPLISKSDLCSVFIKFCHFVFTQFSARIKILQSDGG